MTYFKEALSAPKFYFRRLGEAKPLCRGDEVVVSCTYSAFEAEIEWKGRYYMLYLPSKPNVIERIEQVECEAKERSRGPLLENIVLYEELMLVNSAGHKEYFDVILQEKPKGMMLKDAVTHYKIADLRQAIYKMKARLDAVGFRHNNLRPANIIVCDSGVARPLRYWYAKWEVFSDNDISQLTEFLDEYDSVEGELARVPLFAADDEPENMPLSKQCEGIELRCKGGRYGFVDSDGRQITPYIYTHATAFREGRAVVAKNSKVGVINNRGKKVIPAIYDNIDFDIDTGLFTATLGKYGYIMNYDGSLVRRWEIDRDAVNEDI